MAGFETLFYLFFFFFFFLLLPHTSTSHKMDICSSNNVCDDASSTDIRFPFHLKTLPQETNTTTANRCGYPGFELTCNSGRQTILNIPSSGDFSVEAISYGGQSLWINDPDNCLPKRFLNFNLSNSKFTSLHNREYTFFNCSVVGAEFTVPYSIEVPCMSGDNYTVIVGLTAFIYGPPVGCIEMSTVYAPTHGWDMGQMGLNYDIELTWNEPNCQACEFEGKVCGFKTSIGDEIGCFKPHISGLSRGAKYGIIVGVGIPGLLCLIGITCYISGRIKIYTHRRHHRDTELSTIITPQPTAVVVMGLDGSIIESYPKTIVGDGKRLPNPNDDPTCPICLSDYQPKETLRTIPECNHYFHAQCVDEWLKLNATCPLCRNVPDGTSSHITPSSLWSSSSSSSVSPSVHQTTTAVVL